MEAKLWTLRKKPFNVIVILRDAILQVTKISWNYQMKNFTRTLCSIRNVAVYRCDGKMLLVRQYRKPF